MNGTDPRTIAELKPSEFNPREITDSAMAGLKESVAEFGDISGIVYNRTLDCLVAGHQRVEALRAKFGADLEIEETEDGNGKIETPAGAFVVRFVEWDRNRTEAAMVVANNPAIQGKWGDGTKAMLERIEAENRKAFVGMKLDEVLASINSAIEKATVQRVPRTKPLEMAWVLIGIPIQDYGKIGDKIKAIAEIEETLVEASVA